MAVLSVAIVRGTRQLCSLSHAQLGEGVEGEGGGGGGGGGTKTLTIQ